MPRIFISYRRADSQNIADHIADHLKGYYGEDEVFQDVDDIPPGVDFRRKIEETLETHDIMLVVIGQQWLIATDAKGKRRLDNPDDFVRIEIETALKRGTMQVIPILVNSAHIPNAADLPDSIKELASRQAAVIRVNPDFKHDMNRLIEKLGSAKDKSLSSVKGAVEHTKELLSDPESQIQLYEFLNKQIEFGFEVFSGSDFRQSRGTCLGGAAVDFDCVWDLYFRKLEIPINVFATVCLYGNGSYERFIERAINRWTEEPSDNNERSVLYRHFPVLLLIYACGIAATFSHTWEYLRFILVQPQMKDISLSFRVAITPVLVEISKQLLQFAQNNNRDFQTSRYVYNRIRAAFLTHIPSEQQFDFAFDLFEMLFALCYLYFVEPNTRSNWSPPHAVLEEKRSWEFLKKFWFEGGRKGQEWELLKSGMFDGDPTILHGLLERYVRFASRMRSDIPFDDFPDFAAIYSSTWYDGTGYIFEPPDDPISDSPY